MNYHNKVNNFKLSILLWLITLTTLVFAIIIIGGLTRLNDSGLSMVDWRPIMGTFPPFSKQEWLKVFNLYKVSPEFIYINHNMILDEFKYIFWWEWGHRFIARILGIIFIFPFIYFVIKKRINFIFINKLIIVFVFGIFQALVGWWMVKSGLTDNPYVSPYRLTFHLINALIIFSILLWTTMDYFYINTKKNKFELKYYEAFMILSIILIFITIISGGFMAGTNAGKSFNTFPLMNGKFIPDDYYIIDLGLFNIFENTITINFNHRWIASITFVYIFTFFLYSIISKNNYIPKIILYLVIIFLIFQFTLGILTLLSNVNINYASLHQANSVLLLSSLFLAYHQYKIRKKY